MTFVSTQLWSNISIHFFQGMFFKFFSLVISCFWCSVGPPQWPLFTQKPSQKRIQLLDQIFHKPTQPSAHSLLANHSFFHTLCSHSGFSPMTVSPSPRFVHSAQYPFCWRESQRNCYQMTLSELGGGETKQVAFNKKRTNQKIGDEGNGMGGYRWGLWEEVWMEDRGKENWKREMR